METPLNSSYWESRYEHGETPWDLKAVSPPLKAYIDQLSDKTQKILIPGCGYGHEAVYLREQGFSNVHVLDVSGNALDQLRKRLPEIPESHLHLEDFFEHQGEYDLILEQTFFCALTPDLRSKYSKKMQQLLRPEGTLAGLLFQFPLTSEGPPFGGDIALYRDYFEPYFHIETMETAYNSIPPRAGKELFIQLHPKFY